MTSSHSEDVQAASTLKPSFTPGCLDKIKFSSIPNAISRRAHPMVDKSLRAVARISSTVRGGRHALSQVPGLSFRGRRPQARIGCAVPGRLAEPIAVDDPATECATARLMRNCERYMQMYFTRRVAIDGRASSATSSKNGSDGRSGRMAEVGLLSKMTRQSMHSRHSIGPASKRHRRDRLEVSPNLFILPVLISLVRSIVRIRALPPETAPQGAPPSSLPPMGRRVSSQPARLHPFIDRPRPSLFDSWSLDGPESNVVSLGIERDCPPPLWSLPHRSRGFSRGSPSLFRLRAGPSFETPSRSFLPPSPYLL
ncbi:hypothetical protein PRIPAC_70626 [Pristionchus pacificus]|uniref:Uncharacterized protein n=1 Tax=Pristionchus pacificus TaxID=54126 RepID=A0A2A6BF14_PRIPA|nr:hypothetical protein PRIPAC_70626 [Pristionchus pacificus]|eukprot:PDM64458.1 hypothetical protein PRIPAC_52714 [Pristionchus pacificus]